LVYPSSQKEKKLNIITWSIAIFWTESFPFQKGEEERSKKLNHALTDLQFQTLLWSYQDNQPFFLTQHYNVSKLWDLLTPPQDSYLEPFFKSCFSGTISLYVLVGLDPHPPIYTSHVLGIQVHTTIPAFLFLLVEMGSCKFPAIGWSPTSYLISTSWGTKMTDMNHHAQPRDSSLSWPYKKC
jgi:hypothetical protein